jgi:hypothetical protein
MVGVGAAISVLPSETLLRATHKAKRVEVLNASDGLLLRAYLNRTL